MAAITLPKAKMETENYPLGNAHILLPRHFEDNVCFPKMGYVRSQRVPQKEQENSLKFIFWGCFSSFCNWAKLWNNHMGADVFPDPRTALQPRGFRVHAVRSWGCLKNLQRHTRKNNKYYIYIHMYRSRHVDRDRVWIQIYTHACSFTCNLIFI